MELKGVTGIEIQNETKQSAIDCAWVRQRSPSAAAAREPATAAGEASTFTPESLTSVRVAGGYVPVTKPSCARGRPIIVEWERDARHSAGLSLVR
ncbi:hypothetical protein EVAR_38494_1 [Eumeta japonica]|uniref:Uncharacterized protein n=1 Tax=Eumeta variegata TaxID=151549 RepID=A0A4C1WQH7_EUMVA|nr:hypothetical protein EVAR_38494_1 [Eumeta japonica]